MSAPARNAPCPCGSGQKYKRCCGLPGRQYNAADASSALGISYVTLLDAVADAESRIAAERVPLPPTAARPDGFAWAIPEGEVRRLATHFGLTVRELPDDGRPRPKRTSPARLYVNRSLVLRAAADQFVEAPRDRLDRGAVFERLRETTSEVVEDFADSFASVRDEDGEYMRLLSVVQRWKERTVIRECDEFAVTGRDCAGPWWVEPWDLLHVEAVAVRIGVPASHLLSALVSADVFGGDSAHPQALPSKTLALVGRALTGRRADAALHELAERGLYAMLMS